MPKGTKTARKSRSSKIRKATKRSAQKQSKKRSSLTTMKPKRRRATKFGSKLSPSPKLNMRDNWINFFEFENSDGGGGAWPEVLQATQNSNGTYDFQIWNPPTGEGDEPSDIEWSSDEPVFPAEILEQLTEGLVDRGIRKVFVLEAAAALLPHLPKVDGTLLKNSMRKLVKVDQAVREDTHLLPKRVRKLIERLGVRPLDKTDRERLATLAVERLNATADDKEPWSFCFGTPAPVGLVYCPWSVTEDWEFDGETKGLDLPWSAERLDRIKQGDDPTQEELQQWRRAKCGELAAALTGAGLHG
jgi:hypothetical protein